ncbi:transporter substrate-binding domain-containing protein [Xanthobacter sp. KR7-225]|uniref:transporter substrate-binding domain-containing protein n=1 Tax=Xanthobacter sp. KR7-225 TaxID=3156613 RepID=UPI0032B4EB94
MHAAGAALLLLWCLLAAPAAAQAPAADPAPPAARAENGEVSVATRIVAPFVVRNADGTLSGFSVDLWRAIAAEAGIRSEFKVHGPLPELLNAVRDDQDQVGIAAISITSEREQYLDFSQPMFRSGLAILVPEEQGGTLGALLGLLSEEALKVFGLFLVVLLIPAHLIWFTHRGRVDDALHISRRYFPGLFQGMLWAAEGMVGQAQNVPTRLVGRLVWLIWVYAGVILIAYFTALAATTLTVSSLKGDINGPADLVGKAVATVKGSTSARFLADIHAVPIEFATFAEAVAALGSSQAVAVVYDAPVLLFYSSAEGAGKVRVTGEPFRTENYGIIFPLGSKLRRPINAALLKIAENGTYQQIYDKWFVKKEAQ